MVRCSIEGCGGGHEAHGWCNKHYRRWKRHGNTGLKPRKIKPLKERFEDKFIPVTESGCWLWTASVGSRGYGDFRINKKTVRAHRVSYELYIGQIPEGMCVLHKCDIRLCVNPDHLFLGTNANNSADMVAKGRVKRGAAHGMAKLTEKDVIEIRNSEKLQKVLAKKHSVSRSHISVIRARKAWKHL